MFKKARIRSTSGVTYMEEKQTRELLGIEAKKKIGFAIKSKEKCPHNGAMARIPFVESDCGE